MIAGCFGLLAAVAVTAAARHRASRRVAALDRHEARPHAGLRQRSEDRVVGGEAVDQVVAQQERRGAVGAGVGPQATNDAKTIRLRMVRAENFFISILLWVPWILQDSFDLF